MRMDETSKIWMKSHLFIQMFAYSSKNKPYHPLIFVVIELFHPLRREESIAKYSLKLFCIAFEQNIPQKNIVYHP
jgi:hypothetical protein